MREAVPPILNEKFVHITTKLDETVIIPCVSYASPPATYKYVKMTLLFFQF